MSDHWLFDTLISVDVQHQELLRGFGALLLIPFALFLVSYVRVSFAFIKDRARKGARENLAKMTTYLAAIVTVGIVTVALAGNSQAEGTAEQRWACEQDAFKFCGSEIPNVPRITASMIKNVKKLSPACRTQFRQTG